MALKPTVTACLRDKCGGLYFSDTTGAYDASTNPYGWGTPNMQGSDVTEATLTITFPSGTETEHDLLSQIPSTVTADIDFTVIENTFPDGIYTFTLTYLGTETVTKTIKKLFLCNSQCCIDKMWAKIPEYKVTKDSKFMQNYIEQIHLAQGYLNGAAAGGGCLNTTAADNIIDSIDRICSFNKCDSCN